eukprot:CAMPEP_0119045200 /NCGR_PEP_ID=MMETSP1177-20130426/37943_1 /TAXON_ID=2985 /ORGANISM="Ochromonas sp, Strain CCMP1899" /LENGTH=635 /DNA_ID=CAMNT_0007016563 /DNA_START=88 /DNA_END=1995 /DNA_ORIENTATION=+
MLTKRLHSYSLLRNVHQNFNSRSVAPRPNRLLKKSTTRVFDATVERDTSPFFISTPIYYVNGQPHLGHAYTSVVSDVIARFHRSDGREVYFLTGTDEHGQKVEQSAISANKTPIQFADEVSDRFKHLAEVLDCSHDDFIRTTEIRHKAAVGKLWEKLVENGQIYLGAYEGWYSIRDEAFYTEAELIDGKAPTGAEVEWVKEESYFFKLSSWTDKLLEFYEKNPDFIGPKGRRNEVISFVAQEGGLRDLSVSRTTFSWGIPVPGNPKHVVYVWLDALTNYITALDYPDMDSADSKFPKFWPASLHVVGKDILRFHTVFWPAFLMAADLAPPKRIFAHGWWTKDGEKMSKSVGNVLDPFQLLDQYGLDYLRYFMVAEIPFGNDGDFTHQAFVNKINSELANDFGNLAQRALSFIGKNCDGVIPTPGIFTPEDTALMTAATDALGLARNNVDQQNLKGMCEVIINVAKLGNKYIDVQAPWTLKKTDEARMRTVLYVLAETLRITAILLSPVMSKSCDNMLEQLGCPSELRTFQSIGNGHCIQPGTKILTPTPVFPKIDPIANAALTSTTATIKEEVIYDSIDSISVKEISELIVAKGDEIRALKGQKADKAVVSAAVKELLSLKEKFTVASGGSAYVA